ncbi:glycosyltransferase family 4 protein [Paenibacillus sp. M1]|uniref:Glycosyltransferase family 4 protein n=1 Tax=Paenibacillus haidiansis TaxID=1574488 RepID=A0ABU7VVZ8_9BACL
MLFSHVCNTRSITGAEKLLFFLAKKLSRHFECIIVAPQDGKLTKLARKCGIRTILKEAPLLYTMCAPNENLNKDAQKLKSHAATAEMAAMLAEERPDYVFVNTSVNIIPAFAAKSLGIPVVWHVTEIIQPTPYAASSVAIIDRYSDWIVGISETAVTPFRGHPAENKVSLLYPSWEAEEFRPELWSQLRQSKRKEWGIGADAKVIGYISSFLIAEKGADHFIESAITLAKQNHGLRFVVIGGEVDRVYYQSLKRKLIDSGRNSQFIFVEYEENIEAAYCAMDIVVIPSLLSEGFGMTAMEAMIFGKPVVAYASGGLREILQFTGNERFLVPTGDKEGLQAKISELIETPDTLEVIGYENQKRVEAIFGSEAYENRLLIILGYIFSLSGSLVPIEEALYSPPEASEGAIPAAPALPRGARGHRRTRSLRRAGHKLKRRASLRRKRRPIRARKRSGRKRSRRGSGRARKRAR